MCCGSETKVEEKRIAPPTPEEIQWRRMFWNQMAPQLLKIGGFRIEETKPFYIGSMDSKTQEQLRPGGEREVASTDVRSQYAYRG